MEARFFWTVAVRAFILTAMAITRLVAEGIGPFENLELDLSDGKGNPHLGPHILAGVNGSGKSTILRAIAWVLAEGKSGFPMEEFRHFLKGYDESSVRLHIPPIGEVRRAVVREEQEALAKWLSQDPTVLGVGRYGKDPEMLFAASYATGNDVGFIERPDFGRPLPAFTENALAFGSTIDNQAIQSWLLSLQFRLLNARDRRKREPLEATKLRLEDALRLICDREVQLEVDDEHSDLRPMLHVQGRNLNFSQLSAGVRHTFSWVADFMRRIDQARKNNGLESTLLLLDEVDSHLHPRWQRLLLPAMRKAFPETQIIVSSHSPFVISSCKDAVVHVLKVDEHGVASLDRTQKAPFGESILSAMEGIFDVDSRWDQETDRDLRHWDELKRKEATGKLSAPERKGLDSLTKNLSARSEELGLLVGFQPFPSGLIDAMIGKKTNGHSKRNGKHKRAAHASKKPGR